MRGRMPPYIQGGHGAILSPEESAVAPKDPSEGSLRNSRQENFQRSVGIPSLNHPEDTYQ